MKITRLTTYVVRIPLREERRMISALGTHTVSQFALVRVETDAGVEGAGEASVTANWSGETAHGASAIIDQIFAPRLLGHDPADIDGIHRILDSAAVGNWFAKAAIEMACWDIVGKDAGRPVYELLGGAVRSRTVRCRYSMGAYSLERARATAEQLIRQGFSTIKIKVGGDVAQDVARVKAVREAIGPEPELVIDANGGWDAKTAVAAWEQLSTAGIVLFEQPTPRDDFRALVEVRQSVNVPVMADDIVFDLHDARECLRHQACDVISVYPGKNGGISKAKAIAELADGQGVACSIGSNLEWDVATAAMGHLVVACRNIQVERIPGDMLGPDYHTMRIVRQPIRIQGPEVEVPDRPGLGVEVDWNALS